MRHQTTHLKFRKQAGEHVLGISNVLYVVSEGEKIGPTEMTLNLMAYGTKDDSKQPLGSSCENAFVAVISRIRTQREMETILERHSSER